MVHHQWVKAKIYGKTCLTSWVSVLHGMVISVRTAARRSFWSFHGSVWTEEGTSTAVDTSRWILILIALSGDTFCLDTWFSFFFDTWFSGSTSFSVFLYLRKLWRYTGKGLNQRMRLLQTGNTEMSSLNFEAERWKNMVMRASLPTIQPCLLRSKDQWQEPVHES